MLARVLGRLGHGGLTHLRGMATSIRYQAVGEPADVLYLHHSHDSTAPLPPTAVEVKFLLAPINPSDINTIQGKYPIQPPTLPAVPGHEGVGEVMAVGSQVTTLRVGDRVVPLEPSLGTWRQRAVLPASALHQVPLSLPLAAAATLCINPPTAIALLEAFVDLQPGDLVVQNGATGAVGRAVVQLARARGLRTLNIVRKRPQWEDTVAELTALGADVVTTEDQVRQALAASGLPPPRLALNCVGGAAALAAAKVLADGGVHVTYGGMSMQPVSMPTGLLVFKDISFRGFWLSGRYASSPQGGGPLGRATLLDRAAQAVLAGHLATPVERFPIGRFREALAAARGGYRSSKVVLDLQDSAS